MKTMVIEPPKPMPPLELDVLAIGYDVPCLAIRGLGAP
jgi:hypothetical protein